MLRASSLPAVISFVAAVRLRPAWAACSRSADRTSSRSASPLMVTVAPRTLLETLMSTTQPGHALLGVQRRLHVPHRHAQLHQGDRDRRLDTDHGGLGAEQPDHAHQPGQHPRHERVDDGQPADVEHHPERTAPRDLVGDLALDALDRAVLQISLQAYEEVATEPDDGRLVTDPC